MEKMKILFGRLLLFLLLTGIVFSGYSAKTVLGSTVSANQPIDPWIYQKMLGMEWT